MGFSDSRRFFFQNRGSCEVLVQKHAFKDYPERGFSEREIVELVRRGVGEFEENKSVNAITGSFLFFPKDGQGRKCKLVIVIEVVEIEGRSGEERVIVCSAFREIRS